MLRLTRVAAMAALLLIPCRSRKSGADVWVFGLPWGTEGKVCWLPSAAAVRNTRRTQPAAKSGVASLHCIFRGGQPRRPGALRSGRSGVCAPHAGGGGSPKAAGTTGSPPPASWMASPIASCALASPAEDDDGCSSSLRMRITSHPSTGGSAAPSSSGNVRPARGPHRAGRRSGRRRGARGLPSGRSADTATSSSDAPIVSG